MTTIADILLPYQRVFFTSQKKRKMWISSRQVGKSFTVACILAYKALASRSKLSLCISTGARAASEIVKKCVQFAEAAKVLSRGKLTYSANVDSVTFSTGARILSLPSSTDGANLRGYTAGCVCIDEANFIQHFKEAMQAIAPTLSRDKDAELVVTTTPGATSGPFWELYCQAKENPSWLVQTTTIHDAIKDGLEVDLEALHTLVPDPDIFACEYECKFMKEHSSFIDLSLLQFAESPQAKVQAKHMGFDVGSTGDRSAIATVDELEDGTYFIEDIAVMSKAEYTSQLEVLKQLNAKHQWKSGYIDSVGIGSPIAEFAYKQVSARLKGFAWSVSSKPKIYEHARSLIFQRKLKFASHLKPLITADFENISRIVNEAGTVFYQAGRGKDGHSDAASALFLALWAAHDNPASMSCPSGWQRQSSFGAWASRL